MQNDKTKNADESWDVIISSNRSSLSLRLNEIWRFKDLLFLFVKRDFIATYKQTILGPLWFFLQPLLTTITYTVVFGLIAGLPTQGYPRPLFYLSGITIWSFFSECFAKTSSTFITNANLFSKVYFPRLVVPLANLVSNLIRFGIQILMLVLVMIYYNFQGIAVIPNSFVLLFPALLIIAGGIGTAMGLFVSSLTTKYRDLQKLATFGISLLMYLSPVIFPLSAVKSELFQKILLVNPMTSVVETFRYSVLGSNLPFTMWMPLLYSTCFMVVLLLISLSMFNKAQRNFMDTV